MKVKSIITGAIAVLTAAGTAVWLTSLIKRGTKHVPCQTERLPAFAPGIDRSRAHGG